MTFVPAVNYELIREYRLRRRMTQEELSRISHCTASTLSKIENGRHFFSETEKLISLCKALEIPLVEMFGVEGLPADIYREVVRMSDEENKRVLDFIYDVKFERHAVKGGANVQS